MTGTGSVVSRGDKASTSSCAPTITMPPGRQELRSNSAVSQCTRCAWPAGQLLDGRLRFAVLGVDHDDDRRVAVQYAYRSLVIADDRDDSSGQHVARVVQPNRDDVVESGVGQRFHQQRRFGGRFVAPGDADDVKSLIEPGCRGLRFQHGCVCLFRGVDRLHPGGGVNVEVVVIEDGAVRIAAFHQDPAD